MLVTDRHSANLQFGTSHAGWPRLDWSYPLPRLTFGASPHSRLERPHGQAA